MVAWLGGAFSVALAAVLLTAGTASADKILVSRDARSGTISVPADLVLPKDRLAKLPAIIIVHGSGGVRADREYAYARTFNEMGVAAVVIDSFAPRGIKTTVLNQSSVSSNDMLADAVAVLNKISRHPEIDPERIGLIGFSKGGTVAVKVALRRYMTSLAKDNARFALSIALYPWCGDQPLDFSPAGAPLVMMLGANDTYVGTEACREYAKKFEAAGGKLTLNVYPGAKHDWDIPGAALWHMGRGENASKCIYDEVQPGTWIDRSTHLTVFENGKPTADRKTAATRCITFGVSGGYDPEIAKRSALDIRDAIRAAFHLE
ncbi:MAG: dienelactone hydrolase family protein [Pseudolabrys sp.]|nr:dienelactone hydrolase family protein [Pseudolabrys sp.]